MQEKIPFSHHQYKIISLASGSSGNCYFLGNSKRGVLIDAGIGFRTIKKGLSSHGIPLHSILAVLLTHDHADHIKGLEALISKLQLPVYATSTIHQALLTNRFVPSYSSTSLKHSIHKEQLFSIEEFNFVPFEVIHDSSDNVGYYISIGTLYSCTLATDVGCITPQIEYYAKKSNHLIIESNYDEQMLRTGRYPQQLKERISSGKGHLSNQQTAHFLKQVYTSVLKDIWLCHLSADNNTPELAYKTIEEALLSVGAVAKHDFRLQVLHRGKPSEAKEF